jgi:hypothetical protein
MATIAVSMVSKLYWNMLKTYLATDTEEWGKGWEMHDHNRMVQQCIWQAKTSFFLG